MEILQLPLGPLQTNCYILICQETMQATVIDPAWDGRNIAATLTEKGVDLTHILITHSHFDHVGGLAQLKEEVPVPIYMHSEDVPMLQQSPMSAAFFGMTIPTPPPPDNLINEGDVIEVGRLKLDVLFTPGHAPGHVSYYLADHNVIFSGDVLFQQSIGRTDLPGCDHALLMESIREKLLTLPDETHVLSGHGPATTIGQEKGWNPFLM
ncbi:MAG: MBL fold metallo-hydrolase [Chloroflexi bacterium]|nr:MBL fold metallo-hydrolase [Chloroflexota bacterium]